MYCRVYLRLLVFLSIVVFFVGCDTQEIKDQFEKVTTFTVTYEFSGDVAPIDRNDLYKDIELVKTTIDLSLDDTYKDNYTSLEDVKSLVVKQLELEWQTPSELSTTVDNSDFSVIKNIYCYIVAEDLPEKRIAYKLEVPYTNDSIINLTLDDTQELVDYFKAKEITLICRGSFDKVLESPQELHIKSRFTVTPDVKEALKF